MLYRIYTIKHFREVRPMEKKENTPQRTARRKYEEVNKEKRKQTSGNFGTMIPRPLFEEINAFLKTSGYTKVQLIAAGYE